MTTLLVQAGAQEIPGIDDRDIAGIGDRDTTGFRSVDSLSRRISDLEKELREIRTILQRRQEKEELEALMKEADRLSMKEAEKGVDISRKYFSGVRQQQGLNPNISFGMDFFGSITTSDDPAVKEPGELGYGNNGFYLREAQLSLVAPLDPFTRGKGFLSAGPSGFAVDEIYMEWLNLPLQMNLKAGYFKPEFGFLNRYHDHALPQFDRPGVLVDAFGTGGLGGTGLAANFLLPPLIAHASILDVSFLYGNNPQSFMPDTTAGVFCTGQFLNYYDLSASSYLEIRLSVAGGKNDRPGGNLNSYVGSGGVTYKWTPVGREKYRTLEWRSEFIYGYREVPGGANRSRGFYSSMQNKVGARLWLGARIGYSEMTLDPSLSRWDLTVSADFWQSEFVLTRLQYQYNDRSGTVDHSFTIQVVWAMGPHKHEAY
jgi:hypothetical protein